ncbi:MAG: hypothetical protein ACRCTQ_06590 [Brevinemataceae bacterium]
MKLSVNKLLFLGYMYLLIPFIIFVIGWIKLVISIPVAIICLYLALLLYKDSCNNQEQLLVSKKIFFIIVALISSWVLIVGVVGIFPQSSDMAGRNAMFKDLIEFPWPVNYPKNGMVIYYHGLWLVPALLGKIFGYTVGQICLFLWCIIGLVITVLLILNYLKLYTAKKQILTLVVFMFFSGFLWNGGIPFPNELQLEYMFHSMQLYYNSNQSIAIWLLGILFFYQTSPKNFAFLGLIIVLYSPYAIIGILPFLIIRVFQNTKQKSFQNTLIECFSLSNLISILVIFPILLIYFISNSTTGDGFSFIANENSFLPLLIMYLQGFLIYMIIIYPMFLKDPIFWFIAVSIMSLSTIKYSTDQNFSRSVNLGLFFCYLYTMRFLWNADSKYQVRKKILTYSLYITCIIGSIIVISNIVVFTMSGVYPMKYQEYIEMKYLDYRDTRYNNQWSNRQYKDTVFFKYFAK